MKIVVVGLGGAGLSAIRTIIALKQTLQNDDHISLVAVTAERARPYSPCALPYLLKGDLPRRNLPPLPTDFFRKNRIQVLQGSPVCRIFPDEQTVILRNGRSVKYEKLLIATGSVPVIPRIEGIDQSGVFSLSTISQTSRLMTYVRKHRVKKAVVIGAGFTGLETALALISQAVKTTVVEMLPRVLVRMLDEDMTAPLEEALRKNGIELRLGEEVTKITGETRVNGVRLKTGDLRPADLVVVSIGVKPNIGPLAESGLKTNRGVLVDEKLRTSLDNIYAAGDVAETFDFFTREPTLSATWPNAVEQGRVAGLNMLNQPTTYEGAININVLNINGCQAVGLGRIFTEAMANYPDQTVEVIKWQSETANRKLIIHHNRIIGFQSVGSGFRNLGLIWSYLRKRTDVSNIKHTLLKDNYNRYYDRPKTLVAGRR